MTPWALLNGGKTIFTMPRVGRAAQHDHEPHDSPSRAARRLPAAQRCSRARRSTGLPPTKAACSQRAEVNHGRNIAAGGSYHGFPKRIPNRFARSSTAGRKPGRGEGMEQDHLPIVLPVLDRMRLAPDDNVLDVGCGAGWLSRLLAEQVPEGRVVGMDVSDEMIRRARRNNADLENAMFVVGEAEEIPWDANFFTRAISVEVRLLLARSRARALREIFRVLREGGSAWLLINYYRDNVHAHQWGEVLTVPAHLLSAAEWAGLFAEAGFAGVQHERIPDPTPAPEKYEGRWFRDAAQLRAFRAEGALLVSGTKPLCRFERIAPTDKRRYCFILEMQVPLSRSADS